MKKHLPKIILAIALIVLAFVVFYTCSDTKEPKINLKPNHDSLLVEYTNLKAKRDFKDKIVKAKEIEITDLKKNKQPIKYIYAKGRTEILQAICDTSKVLAAYDSLYIASMINESIIDQQDTLIYLLKDDLQNTDDIVKNRNALIALNKIEIETEKEAHKATKKKLKKQKIKTALVGIAGILTSGGLGYLLLVK